MLKSVKGKRIGVLGLAFKAGTDDTRDSPAMHIVRSLYERDARIVAYDPAAMPAARRELPDIEYVDSPYDVCLSAELLLVLTEWPQFRGLDFLRIRELLANPMILDARNMIDIALMDELGFMYVDNGRRSLAMAERLAAQRQASHDLTLSEHKHRNQRSVRCSTALLWES
jgi:UDPglucose 6-dehydrogenase